MLNKYIRGPVRLRAAMIAAAFYIIVPAAAQAAYRDDVHYTQLQAELGTSTPTGAGVPVSQLEAFVTVDSQTTWMPETTNAEFIIGKTFINANNAPAGVFSGHATAVGREFYGTITSIAPGISNISVYLADFWVAGSFLYPNGTTHAPAFSTSRIGNHSWSGNANSSNSDMLRRLDWVIETDDFLQVVAQGSPAPLLASAFNVIAAGLSDGSHGSGTGATDIDATYVAGRTRPDIVVPALNISLATPRVSAATALLIETGDGTAALSTDLVSTSFTNRAGLLIRNAERVEVIKAALMAGADRLTRNTTSADLGLYRDSPGNQSANGLDVRYGPGQLNIRNSYHIIAAGEQNSAEDGGPGSGTATAGFDYDPAFSGLSGANSTATYALPVSATPRLLTAALVWNLDIDGGTQNSFNATAYVRDLALAVVNVANAGSPVTVFTSQSTVDNTENAWLVVPANARYALLVTRVSGPDVSYDYGIAWQLMSDTDADGAYDGQDNCINVANGPIVRDAGGNSQRDTDGDGYGNVCDADLNNSGGQANFSDLVAFRAAFGTSNANADFDGNGGIVNFADLSIFRSLFGKAPGPSAYAP